MHNDLNFEYIDVSDEDNEEEKAEQLETYIEEETDLVELFLQAYKQLSPIFSSLQD